jgi:hypothetical protein
MVVGLFCVGWFVVVFDSSCVEGGLIRQRKCVQWRSSSNSGAASSRAVMSMNLSNSEMVF